jgi:hypothetical protein
VEYSTDHQNPKHYSRWKIEPIDFIRANQLDALRANIIKYIMRYDAKEGMKDLLKARRYLDWLIEDAQVDDRSREGKTVVPDSGVGIQRDLFTPEIQETRRQLGGSNRGFSRTSKASHPEAVLLPLDRRSYYDNSPSSCEPPDGPGGS